MLDNYTCYYNEVIVFFTMNIRWQIIYKPLQFYACLTLWRNINWILPHHSEII